MQDKLIELLKGFSYACHRPCEKLTTDSCNKCAYEQLAAYLLANGVIVPDVQTRQASPCADEEPLSIIFRIKDGKYISGGWKAEINGKLYGDWIPLSENYHNSEEFLKVAIQILINSYAAVKESLERNDG